MRVAAAVIIFAALAVTGCSSDESPASSPTPSTPTTSATSRPRVVFYAEGTGSKSGSVTLRTESGGTIQKDVALPMGNPSTGEMGTESLAFKAGDFLYIALQNKESSGSVTCRIEVDGKKIDEATSTGAFKVATCQGRVP